MRHDDRGERCRASRELLDDHPGGPRLEPEPSIARIGERAEDAELAERGDLGGRVRVRDVQALGGWNDLLVDELADRQDHLAHVLGLTLTRGQGAEALAESLQQAPRDDRPLDLVRALAD